MKKLISILIPAYNEQDVLEMLFKRLTSLADSQEKYRFEFLFVNDGSRDQTLELLKKYASRDKHVSFINLSRNFGKETAMIAGMDHATGDALHLGAIALRAIFGDRNAVVHHRVLPLQRVAMVSHRLQGGQEALL